MNYEPYQPPAQPPPAPPPRKGWPLPLILLAGVLFASCGGTVGFVMYVGTVGPDTKVYASNEIPRRFLDQVRSHGLLEPDETIKFFYSDALTDIDDGFYFVSDRKVVVYIEEAGDKPATIVPFAKIADAELHREDSFLTDSIITLTLDDGTTVGFPVSNELGRNEKFFDAIKKSMPPKPEGEEP
ncbi:hypothetical protein [Polyangium sp. 6x1]|uniref:hypothetical protein n=1 Tax=Polyangium sp. 6x1 TaxID=3042689 RepID=UPI002482725C|nr:hypothetical protein [Polyangium sp. 6x1]MDI1451594.1 hypothetical protein [Polyangium sp. 6x1]